MRIRDGAVDGRLLALCYTSHMVAASGWGCSGDLCPALKCAPIDTRFGLLIAKMIDEAVLFYLALNSQIP